MHNLLKIEVYKSILVPIVYCSVGGYWLALYTFIAYEVKIVCIAWLWIEQNRMH